MGEVVKANPFGSIAAVEEDDDLRQHMNETANQGARTEGGAVSYMSFSGKKGRYSIGQDGREPGEDEPFLVSPRHFKKGYICWKGGRPVDERMAGYKEPKILAPDPSEHGPFDRNEDGWYFARSFGAKSLENSEQVQLTNNSKSGVSTIADLELAIRERLNAGEPCWPIITFGKEEFESKGYKNDKPVFDIIKWLSSAEVSLWDEEFDPMDWLEEPEKPKKVEKKPARKRVL